MESAQKQSLTVGGEEFSFDLCRNEQMQFGAATVDQWWMPVTQLYAQRQQADQREGNHRSVLDVYWAVVRENGAERVRDAQERYLLGFVMPDMRSEGSRRTFADAFEQRGTQDQRDQELQALDQLISQGGKESLTREQFHQNTWNFLGRPEFPEGSREIYEEISSELLDAACLKLGRGDRAAAHATVSEAWSILNNRIGRRAGHADEKVILDVLSYEARAAFHQAYSVVWARLLPVLTREAELSQESLVFLRFWHQDWIDSSSIEQGRSVSLFHGHVLGLHPGTARFLLTPAGRQLMGDWLQDFKSVDNLQRLLNGLFLCIYDYTNRHKDAAESRRGGDTIRGVSDVQAVEEQQFERRRGRRRRQPRHD